MEKITVLILEDEPLVAASLAASLQQFGYSVVGTAANGEKALQLFRDTNPDLAILDIQIKGSMNGVEVGKAMLQIRKTPLIYLTAHEEYFDEAKFTGPVAFFSKPYNERDLLNTIDLAVHNLNLGSKPEKREERLPNLAFSKNCLWIKRGDAFFKLPIADILWIKADNVYLEFHTKNKGLPYVLTLGMTEFMRHAKYKSLAQVHRSYIVNLAHVTQYTSSKMIVADKQEIALGNTYAQTALAALICWQQTESAED